MLKTVREKVNHARELKKMTREGGCTSREFSEKTRGQIKILREDQILSAIGIFFGLKSEIAPRKPIIVPLYNPKISSQFFD